MAIVTIFFKVVGLLSIPLMILSVIVMVRSIGRARRITQKSLLIQICTSPAFLVLYTLLLGISIALEWAVPVVMLGLGIGCFWGLSTALSVREGAVVGTRSMWYLWLWAGSFAVTQLLALFGTDGATAGGLATMCLSMGIAVGMNGSLLYRHRLLLSSVAGGGSSG